MKTMEKPPPLGRRLLPLLYGEGVKLRGRWGPRLVLLTPVGITILAAVGYHTLGPKEDPFGIFNGWGCAARAAGTGLQVGGFLLLVFLSQSVASETSSGALRSVLCAPVNRRDVLTSKVLWGLLWTGGIFTAVWITALLSGAALRGFGDVVEVMKYGGETAVIQHHSTERMTSILLRVIPLSLPPLVATGLLGLACSVWGVRPATALISALAVYLPLEVFVKPFFPRLSPYLFLTYTSRFTGRMDAFARGLSTAQAPEVDMGLCLISSAAGAILFLSGSFIYFGLRDVPE
ncbi:MAG: ABC transporter permease [Planctomycetota bacterium]